MASIDLVSLINYNKDKEQINKDINDRVSKQQGSENNGKVLGIGEDGNVAPVNPAELDITPEQIQEAVDNYLNKNDVRLDIEKINHGTSDTVFALTPNVFHTWGEVASLDLTLASGEDDIANIYWFAFTSGATATQFSLPETVVTDLIVQPNTYYEISIVDNYMFYSDWSV